MYQCLVIDNTGYNVNSIPCGDVCISLSLWVHLCALKILPRVSCMLHKCPAIDPHPQTLASLTSVWDEAHTAWSWITEVCDSLVVINTEQLGLPQSRERTHNQHKQYCPTYVTHSMPSLCYTRRLPGSFSLALIFIKDEALEAQQWSNTCHFLMLALPHWFWLYLETI